MFIQPSLSHLKSALEKDLWVFSNFVNLISKIPVPKREGTHTYTLSVFATIVPSLLGKNPTKTSQMPLSLHTCPLFNFQSIFPVFPHLGIGFIFSSGQQEDDSCGLGVDFSRAQPPDRGNSKGQQGESQSRGWVWGKDEHGTFSWDC